MRVCLLQKLSTNVILETSFSSGSRCIWIDVCTQIHCLINVIMIGNNDRKEQNKRALGPSIFAINADTHPLPDLGGNIQWLLEGLSKIFGRQHPISRQIVGQSARSSETSCSSASNMINVSSINLVIWSLEWDYHDANLLVHIRGCSRCDLGARDLALGSWWRPRFRLFTRCTAPVWCKNRMLIRR
jgi:hypothetical protein